MELPTCCTCTSRKSRTENLESRRDSRRQRIRENDKTDVNVTKRWMTWNEGSPKPLIPAELIESGVSRTQASMHQRTDGRSLRLVIRKGTVTVWPPRRAKRRSGKLGAVFTFRACHCRADPGAGRGLLIGDSGEARTTPFPYGYCRASRHPNLTPLVISRRERYRIDMP